MDPQLQNPAAEKRRLHPLTLVYRALASLPGLAILILPAIRNPDASTVTYILLSMVYGVFALPWVYLYYHRFRYQITPKEVVIESGVLTRKHRSIPIERILNVEIEQRMLPRLVGLAGVSLETAGGSGAEGQIEYVSLQDAREIREVIRQFQRLQTNAAAAVPREPSDEHPQEPSEPETRLLHRMSPSTVIQCGAFRFSLLYIALIFGALQLFGFLDPDRIEAFLRRQPALLDFVQTAPTWLIVAGGVLIAALMGWLTGILITYNRFHGFTLYREGDKLFKRHGLMTVAEGTIPLKKVQCIILKANILMRLFDRCVLELQTMGLDPDQRGRRVAVPLLRYREAAALLPVFWEGIRLPEGFLKVSGLHIRRLAIRYSLRLIVVIIPVAYFLWSDAWWGLALIPLMVPLALLQYRHHGYAIEGDMLYVRRGYWHQHVWILPLDKVQVFFTSQSIFQRRLRLKTLHLDTAGGSSNNYPLMADLPAELADRLLDELYNRFQELFKTGRRTTIAPDDARPDPAIAEVHPSDGAAGLTGT